MKGYMKKYIKAERKYLFAAILLASAATFCITKIPLLTAAIVDTVLASEFTGLYQNVIALVIFIFLHCLGNVLYRKATTAFIVRITNQIRFDMIEGLAHQSPVDFHKHPLDYYYNLIDHDVERYRKNYLEGVIAVPSLLCSLAVSAVMLIRYNVWIFVGSIVLSFLPMLMGRYYEKPVAKVNQEESEVNEKQLTLIHETVRGSDAIKWSGRIEASLSSFARTNEELTDWVAAEETLAVDVHKGMGVAYFLSQLIITMISAVLIMKGAFSIGGLLASISLSTFVGEYLTNGYLYIVDMRGCKFMNDKFAHLLEANEQRKRESELERPSTSASFASDQASIQVQQLTFAFEDHPIFQDFSMEVQPGECVAIIGETGSGKSTLIRLLSGYYDNYEGKLAIAGQDLRQIPDRDRYQVTYLVAQEPYIFHMDLFDNVSMCDTRGDDEEKKVREALEKVHLTSLLDQYGLDETLDPATLSGGEKKRLATARACYQQAPIIFFDEPTSGLDPEQAENIKNLIFSLDGVTRLVITHDWTEDYLQQFDQVIHLQALAAADQ